MMYNQRNTIFYLFLALHLFVGTPLCAKMNAQKDSRAQQLSEILSHDDAAQKPAKQETLPEATITQDMPENKTTQTDLSGPANELPRYKEEKKYKKKSRKDPLVEIAYKDKDLAEIIRELAKKLKMNVLLPHGADQIKQKVTFEIEHKIPLSHAENYMRLFLHLCGYTMYPQEGFFMIEKVTPKNSTRKPYSLYINVDPDDLPRGQETIRAIYYLSNLQVPKQVGTDPLSMILKEMIATPNGFLFDPSSNGIILTGNANNIASVMKIITELDVVGSRDVVEIFPLYNSSAKTVAKLLRENVIATTKNRNLRVSTKTNSQFYFQPDTRVVAEERSNSLIVMGKETAVMRIKEFVQEYLDAPQDTGRSILHVYDLQYLDSEKFAKTLQDIVTAKGIGTGQAERELAGSERFFKGVKVIAETVQEAETAKTIQGRDSFAQAGKVKVGGNRLIIACTKHDWNRIKTLIEKLDKPQKQVIIEVFIVDLTVQDNRQLSSQLRKPNGIGLPDNLGFQAAHITNPILDNTSTTSPATTLNADLLRLLLGNPADTSLAYRQTVADPGAMILSMRDPINNSNETGEIWNVLKFLERWSDVKILSHPFLVTRNNVRAEEISVSIRRNDGELLSSDAVTPSVEQKDFKAPLKIAATPRLSSSSRMNLQISIEITDFISTDDINNLARNERKMNTNFNIESGQILVIGGLSQLETSKANRQTPILGQIPIIGNLFRGREKNDLKSNLAIFIHPTIVEPKIREGMHKFTSDKIHFGQKNIDDETLFANLKDPITRLFFKDKPGVSNDEMLDNYLTRIEYNKQEELLKEYSDTKYTPANIEQTVLPEDRAQKLKHLLKQEESPLTPKKSDLQSPVVATQQATDLQ